MRDIKKIIPKNHHISGIEVEKSLSPDEDKYWRIRIKITHNDYEAQGYGDYNKDYFVFLISKGGLGIYDR